MDTNSASVSTTPVAPVAPVAPVTAPASTPAPVTTTATAQVETPATPEQPKVFGSYLEKARAELAAKFGDKVEVPGVAPTTTTPGAPGAPGASVEATPGTPGTPGTPVTITPDEIDNFTLDLDADHTKTPAPSAADSTGATTEQAQQTGATTAQTTDPTSTGDNKLAGEEIPVDFTPEEQAAIKKYLQTPTSARFREQAKIIREISKPIDKGGLGRTPSPQEIINAAQIADSFRTMMDDYTSGDPKAADNWARHWMFQMARSADGRIAPAIDPTTNLPVIKPGSVQATASVIQNAVLHPETATLAAETIYKAINEAHTNGAPWAIDALTRIGAPVIHGLIGQLEATIPNVQNAYVTMTDVDGKEVRIPGSNIIKTSQQLIKETSGLSDPNAAPEDPEKAALRARLAKYEQGQRTTAQQQLQATIARANQGFKEFFLHNLAQDVRLRLEPLAKVVAATSDESVRSAAQADFDLTANALSSKMLDLVKDSPVFKSQHTQFLRDIRSGVPVEDARKPLMRTARELYNNALSEEGKKILRSRIASSARPGQTLATNGTIQAPSVPQPQPSSIQAANGTATPVSQIPQASGNPNPAGRPVIPVPQPGMNGAGVPDSKHILPGESRADYFKRQLTLTLGNRQQ